eukprot:2304656-Pyramimonas_sp.AAC.1
MAPPRTHPSHISWPHDKELHRQHVTATPVSAAHPSHVSGPIGSYTEEDTHQRGIHNCIWLDNPASPLGDRRSSEIFLGGT